MKKLSKKLFALAMALVMCLSLLPSTAFAASGSDYEAGTRIGWCEHCHGPLLYSGYYDGNGYGYYCGKCGSTGQTHNPDTQSPAPATGEYCTKCGQWTYVYGELTEEERAIYCKKGHCSNCGDDWVKHDFGPSGDSAKCMKGCGYDNPNYKPLPEGVIQAECGGTYEVHEVNGNYYASNIIAGPGLGNGCVDVKVHDHQCDYCHADMVEREWITIQEPTCSQPGLKEYRCTYNNHNCPLDTNPQKETIPALGHTFGDKAIDNCGTGHDADCTGHTWICSRCSGKEGKDDKGQDSKWIEPHTYDGGKPDTVDGVSGTRFTCTACDHSYFVADTAETHTLTVEFQDGDGKAFLPSVTRQLKEGEHYNVPAAEPPFGYEPEVKFVEGDMPARDELRTIKYTLIVRTQTIQYVFEDGTEAAPEVKREFTAPDMKTLPSIDSPAVEGFTPDVDSVAAPQTLADETVTVTYRADTPVTYTLTVNVYVDGALEETTSTQLAPGAAIPMPSQTYPGADFDRMEGYVATMPNEGGVTINVYFVTADDDNPTPSPEPEPEPEPEPSPEPEPTPEPEPELDIDDPNVPLDPEPELDIEEPDVPLEPEPELDIEDPDVPLADVPETGDGSHIWAMLAALFGTGLAWLAVQDKKRRRNSL